TGCGDCVEKCPFDAINIDEIQNIAVIDEMKCKGCGFCIPECPEDALEQKNLSDQQIYNMIDAILYKDKKVVKGREFEPKIVCFFSNIGAYQAADLAGIGRMEYKPNALIIRLLSISMLDDKHILYALKNGADGVLISGSHPGESPYPGASRKTKERVDVLKKKIKEAGLNPERIRLEWYAGRQAKAFAAFVDEFVKYLKDLDPISTENWGKLSSE
ncbi:MAG: hydrogenase iron-sulfur subunit, partial [Candidatus Marinimicrobia bacterium]|nr:hydrogenase iron-sulfur subunit [Candidatus Neomarinimicrobiota bacterium]